MTPLPDFPTSRDLFMLATGGLFYGTLASLTSREWLSALVVVVLLVLSLIRLLS